MDSKSLTTTEVGRLCRVSDATVKRWEIAGLIKSERTRGGHRRFRAEEVARFRNEQELGKQRKLGDESCAKAATRRRTSKEFSDCEFFHSLLSGREDEASAILIKRFLDGEKLTDLLDGLITKTMHLIGRLWQEGKITVAQEHLASRIVESALNILRENLPVPNSKNRLAMCFAFEGDLHQLPTQCVQIALESEGWEVWNFGGNTPLYSVSEEFDHHSPDMLCISSTQMKDIDRNSRDYASFLTKLSGHKVLIVMGGSTFNDAAQCKRFPADHYLQNFSSVAKIASNFK